MKTSGIREKLHKYVDTADSKALQFISEAIVEYQSKEQREKKDIASRATPNLMTEQELFARVEQSEENLKNGNVLTEEEMDSFITKLNARI